MDIISILAPLAGIPILYLLSIGINSWYRDYQAGQRLKQEEAAKSRAEEQAHDFDGFGSPLLRNLGSLPTSNSMPSESRRPSASLTATCSECGHQFAVPVGLGAIKCPKCAKTLQLS